jgi:hypothetical protein
MSRRVPAVFVLVIGLLLICTAHARTDDNGAVAVELPESVEHGYITIGFSEDDRDGAEVRYVDLTGDRVEEGVVHLRGTNADTGTQVALFMVFKLVDSHYERDWSYVVGEYPEGLEILDLNGDSISEVSIRAMSGNHYSIICFVGYSEGEYRIIFENGTACFSLALSREDEVYVITIGRENWEDPEFSWSSSGEKSLSEVWRWSNGAFHYDAEASASSLIPEKEAVENAFRATSLRSGQEEDASNKFLFATWVAGVRLYKLFQPEDFTK